MKTEIELFGIKTQQLLLGMTIAVLVYLLFPQVFPYPTFLFFNVLLSLQFTRLATLNASINRVVGSIVGSFFGLLIVFSFDKSLLLYTIPVAIAIAVYSSYMLLGRFVPIIAIIMLMLLEGGTVTNPVLYVLHRVFAALVGVLISLVVAYVYQSKVNKHRQVFYLRAKRLLEMMVLYMSESLQEDKTIHTRYYQSFIIEIQKLRIIRQKVTEHQNMFERENELAEIISLFADYYMHLQLLAKIGGNIQPEVRKNLSFYFSTDIKTVIVSQIINDDVLNFHLKEIIKCQWRLENYEFRKK